MRHQLRPGLLAESWGLSLGELMQVPRTPGGGVSQDCAKGWTGPAGR